VVLSGPLADALQRGVGRLGRAPFTVEWLLADVSFQIPRIFTNYSGDASGRFIELAALTSPRGQLSPAALGPVVASVATHQKVDGHFGLDVDLTKPLVKMSPPIPMLWGNARLLVGLVTAARELNEPKLLTAAGRLGDFYVQSAEHLCAASREAEYRASGTYGDGYTCCYFPAIEGLAMLYRATKEARYLKQAERMADFFQKFDVLPVEHSHGNLCAWRGILELYEITGDAKYLERARAKWDAAVQGGYVWPLGGIGERWHVFYSGDEGCSESDWLRLSLELWRFTGQTRYLDMAERLLENQYAANQCPNGGYGMRHFDGDAAGPIATRGMVDEWPFCCSFHGPLGLHFLKAYLAAGSERGVFVNFPLNFEAPLKAGGRQWRLAVRTTRNFPERVVRIEIELSPQDTAAPTRTTLWLRAPWWVSKAEVASVSGPPRVVPVERGYLRLEREFKAGEKTIVVFSTGLAIEDRRFAPVQLKPGQISRLRDVSLAVGLQLLFAVPALGSGRMTLLARSDGSGRIDLLKSASNSYYTVALPGLEATEAQIATTVESGRPIALRPWPGIESRRRAAFMNNLVVVPAESISATALARFLERAREADGALAGPFFGENLEKESDLWIGASGWEFTAGGLLVSGGDVGLMDGQGHDNYRFEFEVVLPVEGQGITGWVVRALQEGDCVMFQLQSADSPYHAPEFKTRPNTLRPHVRHGGEWKIADPVPLPKEVRRGEPHRIAVECRGDKIDVYLDGERVHSRDDAGLRAGVVGFRAAGPAERGLFRKIALQKL
jgi:DUF1680 family protein